MVINGLNSHVKYFKSFFKMTISFYFNTSGLRFKQIGRFYGYYPIHNLNGFNEILKNSNFIMILRDI